MASKLAGCVQYVEKRLQGSTTEYMGPMLSSGGLLPATHLARDSMVTVGEAKRLAEHDKE